MKLLESKIYLSDLDKAIDKLDLSILNNSSILITGGLGLIGSAVVDLISRYNVIENSNLKIYVAARDEQRFFERFGHDSNINFIFYDVTKNNDFSIRFDYIIHCAGVASPNLYAEKPVETLMSNIDGISNLLKYAYSNEVKRVLYVSSSEVYGSNVIENAYSEKSYGSIDIDNIRSSYPVAKRASEMLCKAYLQEYGVDTVVVRPGHIFGPTASRLDKRVSSDFAYKAATGENIELKTAGLQRRSYCYCVDCASAILTVLIHGESGEAYNIGHEENYSIKEMAECYAKEGGVSLKYSNPTNSERNVFNPMNNSCLLIDKIKGIGYMDIMPTDVGFSHTIMILKEILE